MILKIQNLSMIFFAVIAFSVCTQAVHAMEPARIIAVVNDRIITEAELARRVELVMKSSNLPNKPEVIQQVSGQLLNTLIDEKLQFIEAERLGLVVTDEEIAEAMRQVAAQNNKNLEEFGVLLQKSGVSAQAMAEQLKARLAWNKVVSSSVRGQVEITEADIDSRVEQLVADNGKAEFQIAEIFLPLDEEGIKEQEVRALAQKIFDQISTGTVKFPMMAQQFSKGAGANQGGVIGWVQEGQLPSVIETALKNMDKGQVSVPLKSQTGYHIMYLLDKRIVDVNPETTNMLVLRSEIANDLGQKRLEMLARRLIRDLRANALIDYRGG